MKIDTVGFWTLRLQAEICCFFGVMVSPVDFWSTRKLPVKIETTKEEVGFTLGGAVSVFRISVQVACE